MESCGGQKVPSHLGVESTRPFDNKQHIWYTRSNRVWTDSCLECVRAALCVPGRAAADDGNPCGFNIVHVTATQLQLPLRVIYRYGPDEISMAQGGHLSRLARFAPPLSFSEPSILRIVRNGAKPATQLDALSTRKTTEINRTLTYRRVCVWDAIGMASQWPCDCEWRQVAIDELHISHWFWEEGRSAAATTAHRLRFDGDWMGFSERGVITDWCECAFRSDRVKIMLKLKSCSKDSKYAFIGTGFCTSNRCIRLFIKAIRMKFIWAELHVFFNTYIILTICIM